MTFLVDRDFAEAGINPELINPASFNVSLKTMRRMRKEWYAFIHTPNTEAMLRYWNSLGCPDVMDKNNRDLFFAEEIILTPGEDYILMPGEYCLFSTKELVSFPNGHAGLLFIRSSGARGGWDQFNTFIDPGFGYPGSTTLVLEIKNDAPWPRYFRFDQQVAQVMVLTGPSSDKPYQGRYQDQSGAEPPR